MDEQSTPAAPPAQDAPPTEAPAPVQDVQVAEDSQPVQAPESQPAPVQQPEVEEIEYPQAQVPQYQPVDFTNLPVSEDNLIDPNALAGSINQAVTASEERAFQRAQQSFQEQRQEEKGWEKAYEQYPELKNNKEVRDLVHRARLGEVADLLSKTKDPQSVKLPTPSQIAERFFKYTDSAKLEGMKQATENVKVQSSAYVETASKASDDSSDARSKAFQNINNPNKEVAKKARNDLLQSMLWGDK